MGDRLAVMREGKIVQIGTYRELYEEPLDSFVAGFLGDPPISLLACHYRTDTQHLVGEGHLQVPVVGGENVLEHGQQLLLGIRPEHVRLTSPVDSGAMRGRVSHFEPRIADRAKIVYVDLAPELIAAKVPYETPTAVGDMVGLRFDPATLLLFDAQTHRRLLPLSPS